MPVLFPTLDPETGELADMTYYTLGEVAERLHVSHTTVRRRILAGDWPHLSIAQQHYMSAEHVARVMAMSTVEPARAIPECEGPAKLGTPLADRDLEGIR
jgi:AraC-like DNA-binding protein